MLEKKVKLELFLLEGERGFDELTLRSKMTEVVKLSDNEFRSIFYDKGIDESLPNCWEDFKKMLIEYCIGQSIYSIKKFSEENWFSYITRLAEWARIRNYDENVVIKKLRKEYLPKHLQYMLYATDVKISTVLDTLKEIETFHGKQGKQYKEKTNVKFRDNEKKTFKTIKMKNDVVCFNCKKTGHYANDCTLNKKSINKAHDKEKNDKILDTRMIKIGDEKFVVVFDSGSSHNIITNKMVEHIGNLEYVKEEKTLVLIDGSEIKVNRKVKLDFTYLNKQYSDFFLVVENKYNCQILIGNPLKCEIDNRKEIPIKCTIVTKCASPISWSCPIRRYKDKVEFEELINKLEKDGIVEESQSSWCHPVVLTRKKSGSLRFCVDFRKLNDVVELDGFELPKISEIINTLRGQEYFTKIDLKDGFFQIDIKDSDKEKTAFFTGKRLMQFCKMPQGYKNSPAIFQRVMLLVLKGLVGEICLVYIDDILVFGQNKEIHDKNLRSVVKRLAEYGLKENLEKRVECVKNIDFLGFNISLNVVKPNTDRANGIINYQEPKTKKQLQRFLGLINYDRNFIKDLSPKLSKLYACLHKDKKFKWTDEESKIFKSIKENWTKDLYLIISDHNKSYTLETDASDTGLGAVLLQENQPVAYISRLLSKAEKNYSITEKEVLAALWAMEKLEYYLIGKNFVIYTDHKAMEELKKKKEFGSSRIVRWFERLERFDFIIKHKPGIEMQRTDALSRASTSVNMIKEEVKNLEKEILNYHQKKNHRKNISEDLKKIGINTSKYLLNKILKQCLECKMKEKKSQRSGYFIETSFPGERVAADILEISKNTKVLVIIDYFSRKIFAKLITGKQSSKVLDFIAKVNKILKMKVLQTDNGKEFSNQKLSEYLKNNRIIHKFSIPYYHPSNGRVERANRTIREGLKKTKGPVRIKLKLVVLNNNNSYHRGIGMSPEEAMKTENYQKVIDNSKNYQKKFRKYFVKHEKFYENDKVLLKNELKSHKMDNEFEKIGTVTRRLGKDAYEVELKEGNKFVRHASQLKLLERGKLDVSNIYA